MRDPVFAQFSAEALSFYGNGYGKEGLVMMKGTGSKLREGLIKAVFALGASTVQSFTRANAYEPQEDAKVYRLLKGMPETAGLDPENK